MRSRLNPNPTQHVTYRKCPIDVQIKVLSAQETLNFFIFSEGFWEPPRKKILQRQHHRVRRGHNQLQSMVTGKKRLLTPIIPAFDATLSKWRSRPSSLLRRQPGGKEQTCMSWRLKCMPLPKVESRSIRKERRRLDRAKTAAGSWRTLRIAKHKWCCKSLRAKSRLRWWTHNPCHCV